MTQSRLLPQSVREAALEDAGHACTFCPALGHGADGDATLHVHHRERIADGGTHNPENLVVLCEHCHQRLHSGRTTSEDIETDFTTHDFEPTPADLDLLKALEQIGPASTGELAAHSGVSEVHTLRRLYALGAARIVCKTAGSNDWDLDQRCDSPLRGELPDDPEQAARLARDIMILRMREHGLSIAEVAEVVGLSERTIPIAVNRARAFDPPLPPGYGPEPDLSELSQRVASLERLIDDYTHATP